MRPTPDPEIKRAELAFLSPAQAFPARLYPRALSLTDPPVRLAPQCVCPEPQNRVFYIHIYEFPDIACPSCKRMQLFHRKDTEGDWNASPTPEPFWRPMTTRAWSLEVASVPRRHPECEQHRSAPAHQGTHTLPVRNIQGHTGPASALLDGQSPFHSRNPSLAISRLKPKVGHGLPPRGERRQSSEPSLSKLTIAAKGYNNNKLQRIGTPKKVE
jgi:hypothetical protein